MPFTSFEKGSRHEQSAALDRHFDMAENQIAKTAAIAQHLVDFVRPHQPRLEDVDLAQLVADVIETVPPPAAITRDHRLCAHSTGSRQRTADPGCHQPRHQRL